VSSHGPYETEEQARLDGLHVYDAGAREPGLAYIGKINGGLLYSACRSAGVSIGAYDREVLADLAGRANEDVQVVTGLIERAYAGGRDQLAAELAELKAQIASLETQIRHAAPVAIDLTPYRTSTEGKH
jgi:hypothetical protein